MGVIIFIVQDLSILFHWNNDVFQLLRNTCQRDDWVILYRLQVHISDTDCQHGTSNNRILSTERDTLYQLLKITCQRKKWVILYRLQVHISDTDCLHGTSNNRSWILWVKYFIYYKDILISWNDLDCIVDWGINS